MEEERRKEGGKDTKAVAVSVSKKIFFIIFQGKSSSQYRF